MGRLQKQLSFKKGLNKTQKHAGPIQREYAYDTFGNLSQLTDGPVETRYVYDLVNRLKKTEGHTAGTSDSQSETFDFDPAGNLLGINDGTSTAPGSGKTFGRLTTANSNSNSKTQGNRLAFQGDRKFTYDARGNLIKENRGKEGKLDKMAGQPFCTAQAARRAEATDGFSETVFDYNLQNQLSNHQKRSSHRIHLRPPRPPHRQKRHLRHHPLPMGRRPTGARTAGPH
ncbi:MAG: YD repeat-containing protein [Ulvibacter sp.]|jgi:YD repeat-containing protein